MGWCPREHACVFSLLETPVDMVTETEERGVLV